MKFIYIDDSYFKSSSFLEAMKKRMFSFCEREHISHILLSCGDDTKDAVSAFLKQCQKRDISLIQSPAVIDWGKLQGILTPTAFHIKDGDTLYPYSGCAVFGNSNSKDYQRVYFEMFLAHDGKLNADSLESELSELLHDILHLHKKTNQYN